LAGKVSNMQSISLKAMELDIAGYLELFASGGVINENKEDDS
jgi:hypothetical protein